MGKKQNKKQTQEQTRQHFQVFVSGLLYETTEQELKNFFEFTQQPTIKLPKYQDTGRCLGYGHVQFSNQDDYQKALLKDGQHLGARYVVVKPAKGKKQVQPQNATIPVGCKVLFVKNLPYQISEEQINKEFTSCGVVKDVRMIRNWQTKKFKGFAYIDFKDNGSVKKAIAKYHGKPFKGRNLVCDAVTTTMKKGFKRNMKGEQDNEQFENEQQQQIEAQDNQDQQ